MATYRVSLHCRRPLKFAVERLNKVGRAVAWLGNRDTLQEAIDDAVFFGTAIVVTDSAMEAARDHKRRQLQHVHKELRAIRALAAAGLCIFLIACNDSGKSVGYQMLHELDKTAIDNRIKEDCDHARDPR